MRKFIRDLNANGNGFIRMLLIEAVKMNLVLLAIAAISFVAWGVK